MVGATLQPIIRVAAGTAATAASPLVLTPLMSAVPGQALTARTQMPAKIQAGAIAMATPAILATAGATPRQIIPDANGMVVIAANQLVAMEPTRVALWDIPVVILQPVKTLAWVALKNRDQPYTTSSKYLQNQVPDLIAVEAVAV